MKRKLFVFVAIILSLFVVTGCGSTKKEETSNKNAIEEYLDKGYTYNGISADSEDSVNYVLTFFLNSSDKTDFEKIEVKLSTEEYNKWDAIDVLSDTYESDVKNYLISLPKEEITVTNLNDKVISNDDLQEYVGKTIKTLLDEDYYWSTDSEDENGNTVHLYLNMDTNVLLGVYSDEKDFSELSDTKIAKLKINDIKFYGFDIA